jgi:hypothetical protein
MNFGDKSSLGILGISLMAELKLSNEFFWEKNGNGNTR